MVGVHGRRCCFFFNDTATTEIYTLSLHDALPICLNLLKGIERGPVLKARSWSASRLREELMPAAGWDRELEGLGPRDLALQDRKSTRLNSSHANISYAVFCLKKKNDVLSPIRGYT